jgi:hypothetical protein
VGRFRHAPRVDGLDLPDVLQDVGELAGEELLFLRRQLECARAAIRSASAMVNPEDMIGDGITAGTVMDGATYTGGRRRQLYQGIAAQHEYLDAAAGDYLEPNLRSLSAYSASAADDGR